MTNRDETITPNPVERLQQRRRLIEFLMRLEFPGSNAPPPLPTISASATRASIETAQANQEAWQRQRDAQDARRAELSKMTDEQLDALVKQAWAGEQERDRARREKQTPPAQEPDWQFWTREDEWMMHDAALLLVNLEPRTGLGLHLKKMLRDEYNEGGFIREDHTPEGLSDEARAKLGQAQEIVRRARVAHEKSTLAVEFSRCIDSEKWHGAVEPRPFLRWAQGKGYTPPPALAKLIDEQPRATGTHGSASTPAPALNRDILSPIVEEALQGTDGTFQSVYPKLRELALAKKLPFTGELARDGGLLYLDTNSQSAKLTKDAIAKRLKRRR